MGFLLALFGCSFGLLSFTCEGWKIDFCRIDGKVLKVNGLKKNGKVV